MIMSTLWQLDAAYIHMLFRHSPKSQRKHKSIDVVGTASKIHSAKLKLCTH